jgi:hypothetical protein
MKIGPPSRVNSSNRFVAIRISMIYVHRRYVSNGIISSNSVTPYEGALEMLIQNATRLCDGS